MRARIEVIAAVPGAAPGAGPDPARRAALARAMGAAVAIAMGGAIAVTAAPAASQQPAVARDVAAALVPDSATVGDVVIAAVRLSVPRGARVALPEALALPADVEEAGPRELRTDTLDDGRLRVTALYRLVAWRPGEHELGEVAVAISPADGRNEETARVTLPGLRVLSVLPADTAGIEARPPKDVLGSDRRIWPFLLGLLLAALIAALIWWWLRRRRRARADAPALVATPRERALAAIDRARELGLVERGELAEFYAQVSRAVRDYLDEVRPGWSVDLTTSELEARVGSYVRPRERRELIGVLLEADRVKFARYRPGEEAPYEIWRAARDWVAGFDPGTGEESGDETPAGARDAALEEDDAAALAGGPS